MNKRKSFILLIGAVVIVLFCVGIYFLPPVQSRLAWRLASLHTKIHYYFNPPDEVVFLPLQTNESDSDGEKPEIESVVLPEVKTLTPSPSSTTTPVIQVLPTQIPTALPDSDILSGITHEYQSFNNCGPANLSMLLSYWGWDGDQRDTKGVLRPNEDDANVMPEELQKYIQDNTDLRAILRFGGDIDLVKRLIAAGYPVIIEIGHHPPNDWWMGHYVIVSGYDDTRGVLITQDSLIMPDLPVAYTELQTRWWRDFNNVYLLAFPPEKEVEIASILGTDYDPGENLQMTLQKTESELGLLTGRDLFFGYLNEAETLTRLGNFDEAVDVFDTAFNHYNTLDEEQRPWRVLWYRVKAYQAYYRTGHYQTVIDLAKTTLSMLNKRGLEESHYWRGMAFEASGEFDKARSDYEIALQLRPTYQEALDALNRLNNY